MAQLISSLDAVYKRSRNSWQDTSPPPNLLVTHLGPGEITLDLQVYNDIANQSYHRDSMKGQTADIPNLLFLFQVPAVLLLTPRDFMVNPVHKDSLSGQVVDPQNWLLSSGPIIQNPGQPGSIVINPVFNKHPTQETTIQRNPVLDVISNTQPFFSPVFEVEQNYRKDSLSGQYARSGIIGKLGVPPAFNEIYTYVFRPKTAQEPFVYPNVIITGILPSALPFIQRQGEDHQWRGKKTQETFDFPNVTAIVAPVTRPFVQTQSEDHQWRGKKTQETYDFPNFLAVAPLPKFFATDQKEDLQFRRPNVQETYTYPNLLITQIAPTIIQPFVQTVYSDANYRSKKTQEHYDFPNVIFYDLPPLPPPAPLLPVMPNLIGMILMMAEATLKKAGVLVPASIGYFGTGTLRTQQGNVLFAAATWPIVINWVSQTEATQNVDGNVRPTPAPTEVIGQSPPAGTQLIPNSTVTLTVVQSSTSISYPGTNLTNGFN